LPSDVEHRIHHLYGHVPGPAEGVLQVTAVAREGDDLIVIRIGEHAPKSDTDWLVLSCARARVDAILVSGSVLRFEPDLFYAAPDAEMAALWPRERPPWLCVMTRSGDLPADHGVWGSAVRPMVYTGPDADVDHLPDAITIVRDDDPSPRAAIRHLREARSCRSVSVEAGPRVSMPLYDDPPAIDELMLSVFEGELDPKARGARFHDEATLTAALERVGGPTAVDEPSGRWVFSRLRARRGTAAATR